MALRLLIGCNSYLGQNLARALADASAAAHDGHELVVTSRNPPNTLAAAIPGRFVQEDLERSHEALQPLRPRELFVVSRPPSMNLGVNLDFYGNLKRLVDLYARRFHLKRVVFFSTQLVYDTPSSPAPIRSDVPLCPKEVYEYSKADFELFLRCMAETHGLPTVEIFRLPLLFGGRILPVQRREQLMYQWCDGHAQGRRWDFTGSEDAPYGTGFAWVPDLVRLVAGPPREEGFHTRNTVSGRFTFRALETALRPIAATQRDGEEPLWLPRSTFYMADESGLPGKSIEEAVRASGVVDG